MHVNLLLSVKTDSINKGSKIIYASSVDGNSSKTITDPKAIKTKQECLVAYGNGNG